MLAEMRKLILVGSRSETQATMDLLHKSGCAEIAPAREEEGTFRPDVSARADELALKLADIEFSFEFITACTREAADLSKKKIIEYKKAKKEFLAPQPTLTFGEFTACKEREGELANVIGQLKELSAALTECSSEKLKCENALASLAPYAEVEEELGSFAPTAHTYAAIGTVTTSEFAEGEWSEKCVWRTWGSGSQTALAVVCHKEDEEEVRAALSDMEFSPCPAEYVRTYAKEKEEIDKRAEDVASRRAQIVLQGACAEENLPMLKLMRDYYSVERAKVTGSGLSACTATSYVLEAWVPLPYTEQVDKLLEGSGESLSYYFEEPKEGDDVPTYAMNNSLVTPYEPVTNMFSAPKYRELDPNPHITAFFFLFFGMMLADVGYGVLLTLFTSIYLAKVKPPRGRGNMIKLLCMGGISTIIWGFFFGSYFGVGASDLGIWYWFNPIDDPITMLFLSLGAGLVQMLYGYFVNMVSLFRQKKPLEAIFGNTCWYFLVFGVAAAFFGSSLASWLPYLGYALLGVGILFLILSGVVSNKGIKRLGSGLGKLYGIVNFFSDLMSYTRIFGLGLASAVIAMVFNQIGIVIKDMIPSAPAIGWLIACVIFFIGHTFNLGINTLGSYVHDSRLQFVEFFGKFYEGGGRLFTPLGSEMKYYYVDEKKYEEKPRKHNKKSKSIIGGKN